MDNERKVNEIEPKSKNIFLDWKNLEIGNKELYDLEKEFSATKKNRNYLVIVTILIFLIVFVGTAYAVTRYIQESGRIVPIEIKDFEDVNLKDILDIAKNYEQSLSKARKELKELNDGLALSIDEEKGKTERETQIIRESGRSDDEKRSALASVRRKERNNIAALEIKYGKQIEAKEKEISEIEKAIASYDATVLEQAREQEELLNNQRKMADLEMAETVGNYENRISEMEKRYDSEITSLKRDNQRLVSVLKKRYSNELDAQFKKYNPVFEKEKYLKILSEKGSAVVPEYADDKSVRILDENRIISADNLAGVRKDAADIETILKRLKEVPYENSVPEALEKLLQKGSRVVREYEDAWQKSAVLLNEKNTSVSAFSAAFDYYISETGVSGYILFTEDNEKIVIYMNRILEISDGDRGYVFRSDSEMIGEIEFYHENGTLYARNAGASDIKPFDRILVQVE